MTNKTLEDCIRQSELLFGVDREETMKNYNNFYSAIINSYNEDDNFTDEEIKNKAIEKVYKFYENKFW